MNVTTKPPRNPDPHCTGCGHWRPFLHRTARRPVYACLYCLDIGQVRGISVRSCRKNQEATK